MNSIEKLLYLRGVAAEYFSYAGDRIHVAHETRLRILGAMGYDLGDDRAVQQAIYQIDALPWRSWLPEFSISVLDEKQFFDVRVHPDQQYSDFSWRVTSGSGEACGGSLVPAHLEEVGEYYIEGIRYSAYRQPLPELEPGYYALKLSSGGTELSTVLAVAPRRCVSASSEGKRLWGISCQLYTLRSRRNWGIGDFTDLLELVGYAAATGMDLVGLNPMHAPNMAADDFSSPYSASDRRFLNPLYIDPEQVAEYHASDSVGTLTRSPGFVRKLASLRAAELVDYSGVAALKYWVFEAMFLCFLEVHLRRRSERGKAFEEFVRRSAGLMQAFAEHEAQHSGLSVGCAQDPRFYQYLQWVAGEQLAACQSLALERGMRIGLLGDMAVGAARGGAEIASKPELFCDNAAIGAPPDQFTEEGQNWNLPALDPLALQQDNYHHFIQLLRANMLHCGALRIDHVMGLLRLWWCLPDIQEGAYVYYPFEDLIALLRLESHRNRCAVVGEDMGVVPQELRERMADTRVYSNKLFYFEREPNQQFSYPQDQQEDSLLMVTNHDVATLAGWWSGTDLKLKSQFGSEQNQPKLSSQLSERRQDKSRLLAWLESLELLPAGWSSHSATELPDKAFDIQLCRAILVANARGRSEMMLFQLDDLQLLEEPVNIPGTHREYPNWRRKQKVETREVFEDPVIKDVLAAIDGERRR